MKISNHFFRNATFHKMHEPLAEAKQEIFDILQQSPLEEKLEPEDKKLIESVVDFRKLIVREVMVPRVDLFALPAETSVKDAAKKIQEEGYSRTPVYKGTIDELVGILMYKDLLATYMEAIIKNDLSKLDQPIEGIVKPPLFTPETKKISHLLQEFRKRQMHLAIVVDEYGGTEGIITIEDILESLVGEIEDEYDEEKDLYITLPDGSYIVDAKISLLDLEELLNIILPEEGDFDTLGGYVFHKAGEIPKKGFKIKLDTIELEVIRATDRAVEKVKIRYKS
jgi:CBS domain containing-hemolysin-like protein